MTDSAPELELVIGSKHRSSWSLRPWLLLAASGIPFRETRIPYHLLDWHARVRAASPNGKVPALRRGALVISESLAIIETIAELHPELELWPADRDQRALARSLAAEVHAGFAALRRDLTMYAGARVQIGPLADDTRADIARFEQIASERLDAAGGPFLFGRFGAVDAMFAPFTCRFVTYGVDPGPAASRYGQMVQALPAMQRWITDAAREIAEEPAVLGPGQPVPAAPPA
jgi:glutathione S-transferase